MKKEPQKGRIFNPSAKIELEPTVMEAVEVSKMPLLAENLKLRARLKSISEEIRKFAEDQPISGDPTRRVALKSGANLGELFTRYIKDDRWYEPDSGTPRHVLTDLEQDIKKIFIEISESIKDKSNA